MKWFRNLKSGAVEAWSDDSAEATLLTAGDGPDAFTKQTHEEVTVGNGGSSSPIVTGAGSPVGVVTPDPTKPLYLDTDSGGLFVALGATDADWVVVGGNDNYDTIGTFVRNSVAVLLGGSDGGGNAAVISDFDAQQNSGNGIYWRVNGGDGEQGAQFQVGADGAFVVNVGANGTLDTSAASGVIFPTADPHVAGAWWDDAGTLTRSSG